MEVGCIYCRIACKFKRRVSTIELLFVCVRQNRHFVCPFSECSSNCGFTATFKKHLRKCHDADIKYFDEESQQTQTGTKRPHGDDQMATSPENNEEDMLFNWTYCNTSEHKSSLRRRGPCCIRRSLRDRRRARTEDPFSALWQVASAGTHHWVQTFDISHAGRCTNCLTDPDCSTEGEFRVPLAMHLPTDHCSLNNTTTDSFLRHTLQNDIFGEKLKQSMFVEMSGELATLLQEDWMLSPQMRYVTPKLFSGAILVENHQILGGHPCPYVHR